MNKVLVTGATGKSGMYLLKELQKSPLEDFTFGFTVRSKEKGDIVKEYLPDCEIHIGDLKDESFLRSVFVGGGTIPYCIYRELPFRRCLSV